MKSLTEYIKEAQLDEGLFSSNVPGTEKGKNNVPGLSDEHVIFYIARKKSGREVTDADKSDMKKFNGGISTSNNLTKVTVSMDLKNQKDVYDLINKLGSKYVFVSVQFKYINDNVKTIFKNAYGDMCKIQSNEIFITVDSGMTTQNFVKALNKAFYNR